MERSATHGLALTLAAFPLVGSGFVALLGLWGSQIQCDESCTGDGWQHTAGAPQWMLLAFMGFAVFASGIALFVSVYRSRPWHALSALLVGTAVLISGLGLWHSDWSAELRRHPLSFGAVATFVLLGAMAAFLCAPAERGRATDRTG